MIKDIIDFLISKTNITIVISVVVLIMSLVLSRFLVKLVLKIILKIPSRSRSGIKEKIVASIEKPLIFFVLVLGVFIAIYLSLIHISLKEEKHIYHQNYQEDNNKG